jgi:hypothetical protein
MGQVERHVRVCNVWLLRSVAAQKGRGKLAAGAPFAKLSSTCAAEGWLHSMCR